MKRTLDLDFNQLLESALRTALAAGKSILEIYSATYDIEYKDDTSPLTTADKESHLIISRCLRDALPDIPQMSEEGRDIPWEERQQWDHCWLIDPLDGTKEFIKRNGEFTVNIALIEKNYPVVGVIYAPVPDILYFAISGKGAFRVDDVVKRHATMLDGGSDQCRVVEELKDDTIALPTVHDLQSGIKIIGSRSHMNAETEQFIARVKKRHRHTEIVSAGSSLKLCLIAEGTAQVYPRFAPTMEWDTAAGQIIVEEAGGSVTDRGTGKRLVYNKTNHLKNEWFLAISANAPDVYRT